MIERPSLAGWIALALLNCGVLLGYLAAHPNFCGDFCAFYAGAQVYHHSPSQLYNPSLQRQAERAAVGRDDIPFDRAPYELLLWLPLSRFPFHTAFWMWRVISLGLLAVAARLLSRTLATRYTPAGVFAIALAFFPVPYSLWMGEDSILLLAIFTGAIWFLSWQHEFLAGLVLGLAVGRLELILPIALVYLLWRRWRLVGGIICSGAAMAAISLAMVGRSGIARMISLVLEAENSKRMAEHPVMMPNLRGLIALLPIGHPAVQTAVVLLLSIALLVTATLTLRGQPLRERQFARLVCFALLISFRLNLHGLTLLLLPTLVILQDRVPALESKRKLGVLLVGLFCTPLYIVTLGAFKVAVLALLVGWLWFAIAKQRTTLWPQPISQPVTA